MKHQNLIMAVLIAIIAVMIGAVAYDVHARNTQTTAKTAKTAAKTANKVSDKSDQNQTAQTASQKTIVLDPGHSAVMPSGSEAVGPGASETKAKDMVGTKGVATGVTEYDFMLTLANKLKPELEKRGYKVVLTRTDSQSAHSCIERAQVANDNHADAFVRLHANAAESAGPSGAMTINITANNPYTSATYSQCRKLSDCVLNAYVSATGAKSEGVSERDDLTGNNWAKVPTTLIEVGYMTNPEEDKLMQTDAYQAKMIQGIANGIDQFFKN
ncbi:N-acetylmuramoyl-L-alanine amidase family protein [Pseudoramibacter sp.]|jgi:N-acetylmuramoyl-L-alanine amidase|uniref:N-acetylmuramoyl-L-alanine amidase family protein n=1 Tax=Pseudoramibacter sp. TaxID=2034862 RepID=UPI002600BDF7|nr:N-acetylmuramoyl-L-alanine amidase [Pseudoramibacter sp.]MCH4071629.1 N-acetylmuramoyl-L-alanine amidase [Pseudoramibacter sp.]MCH4105397.1 N-acetylmuramoyl-L-alanine amidase [Pseudoramibacter sp.]